MLLLRLLHLHHHLGRPLGVTVRRALSSAVRNLDRASSLVERSSVGSPRGDGIGEVTSPSAVSPLGLGKRATIASSEWRRDAATSSRAASRGDFRGERGDATGAGAATGAAAAAACCRLRSTFPLRARCSAAESRPVGGCGKPSSTLPAPEARRTGKDT